MKKICICIPCYNEEENIGDVVEEIQNLFETKLTYYSYELLFIDNASTDNTQDVIRSICSKNKNIKAIFNVRNFKNNSAEYCLRIADGDCNILIPADLQVPIDCVYKMIKEWEHGSEVVCAIKTSSEEKKRIWLSRQLFYFVASRISNIEFIQHFTGYGLYGSKFMNEYRKVNDPLFSTMQFISTHGWNVSKVYFSQPIRKKGKSKTKLRDYVDVAIFRLTSMSTILPRLSLMIGFVFGFITLCLAVFYFILKIIYWDLFQAGMIPVLLSVLFIGNVQLIFMGIIGEYVTQANIRLMNRPLVIEAERINFLEEDG